MKGTWRVVAGLLVFWLLVLLYMSANLYNTSDVNERTERQLAKALEELDLLRKQNRELDQLASDLKEIQEMLGKKDLESKRTLDKHLEKANQLLSNNNYELQKKSKSNLHADGSSPSLDHEQLRRKAENGIREMWYYVHAQISNIGENKNLAPEIKAKIDNMLIEAADHQRTLLTDMYNLSLSNDYGTWREQEAEDLSNIVQQRLHHLQNPSDCSKAKKLVCNMNKGCGYGCQLHHVVYCFILAYGTQRTFILESKGWRYSPSGWEQVFKPISDTCTDRSGSGSRTWGAIFSMDNMQVIDLPIVDNLNPRPAFLPQSIPRDLAPRIMRLHGHPFVWWVGQFMKYLLRPSSELAKEIEDATSRLGFEGPIVGVHVRRTDKVGTEAAFHSLSEYMVHVEDYYALLGKRQRVLQKKIYLATDDPNLLDEARKKYVDYKVISDNQSSRSASLSSRYTEGSLHAVILDIYFLSRTDYLVCTFSSQVCRVAYEIMQSLHPDASSWFKSLDDVYYFGGQHGHDQVALQAHKARNPEEMEMFVGDKIGIAGNHWNGFSKGKNYRTGRVGLYPSYKVAEDIRIADFPTFSKEDSKSKR